MEKQMEVNLGGKTDILQGRWRELKGFVKQRWSKLTAADIAKLTGRQDELVGLLQQRYGYGKEQAELEINKWLSEHDREQATQPAAPKQDVGA